MNDRYKMLMGEQVSYFCLSFGGERRTNSVLDMNFRNIRYRYPITTHPLNTQARKIIINTATVY